MPFVHEVNTSERETHFFDIKKLRQIISVLMFPAIMAQNSFSAAYAAARYEADESNGNIMLILDQEKGKPSISFKLVDITDIGKMKAPSTEHSSFFERLKAGRLQREYGVNYTVEDPEKFNAFLMGEIEKFRTEHGVSGELSAQDVIQLSWDIVKKNMPFLHSIVGLIGDEGYDLETAKKANALPLDRLLFLGGVCRHQTAVYVEIFNRVSALSQSSQTAHMFAQTISKSNKNHANVGIYELTEERERLTVNAAEIDITRGKEGHVHNGYSNDEMNVHQLLNIIDDQFGSLVSSKDRIIFVREFMEKNKDIHVPNATQILLSLLAGSYGRAVQDSVRMGKIDEAEALFIEADDYFRKGPGRFKGKKDTISYVAFSAIMSTLYRTMAEVKKGAERIAILEKGSEFNFTFLYPIARHYRDAGDVAAASRWYKQLLEKWKEPTVFEEAYDFFQKSEQYAEADKLLRQFESHIANYILDIDKIDGHVAIARLYHERGERKKQLDHLKEAYAQSRSASKKYFSIGKHYAETLAMDGKYDEAIVVYHELFKSYQKNAKQQGVVMPEFADEAAFNAYLESKKREWIERK